MHRRQNINFEISNRCVYQEVQYKKVLYERRKNERGSFIFKKYDKVL